MREIKYRLWDKLANKMVTAPSYWSITLDGKVFYGNADMSETVVLMQDTGLKDKNGVEIHEGDIVDIKHWSGKMWEVKISSYDGTTVYRKDFEYLDDYAMDNPEWYRTEIIGNIYENPELLNN